MSDIKITPEIQKQLRETWLQRLEKNDLPQTRLQLQNHKGYCCLGVACKVYEDLGIGTVKRGEDGLYVEGVLPEQVMRAFGFKSCYGGPTSRDGLHPDTLNDTDRLTFPQIAKVIRETPDFWNDING